MADKKETLFRGLTRLFRSGPLVKRKVRMAQDSRAPYASSALDLFKKSQSHVFNNAMNAYGSFDRMSRYADFSEMLYCLSADTRIATPSGYVTIGELAEQCAEDMSKTFIVYAYDHEQKQIVPALGKQARQTTTDHAWKVTFDSGKSLIGSANHRLMKRDGTYCRIDELAVGDSMMPFYRRDLFAGEEGKREISDGYRWIYTMDKPGSSIGNGWVAEHRLIASWIAGRDLEDDEVVHHVNFVKHDNRPENLRIMTELEHKNYHAQIINAKKWSPENSEWIEKFKQAQSKFMREHNPMSRHDITFGRILETCESIGFNIYRVSAALDADLNLIKHRLRKQGFKDFVTFAKAYCPGWKSDACDNRGTKNPRYKHGVTFQSLCDMYEPGMTSKVLCEKLGVTYPVIKNRLRENGYASFKQFRATYQNHKVVSIEYHGVIPLYDLTVDGYKNFATDSVMSHNTAEISSALDIYCLAGDNTVLLLDGSTPTVEDLYKQHASDFRVYSYDPATQKLRHCVCTGVTKTGTDQPICRVTLEDDCVMRLTSRHLVMTADGSYKRVEDLKPGDGIVCADRRADLPPCTHGWSPTERDHCEECEEADREAGRHLLSVRKTVVAVKSIVVDGFDDVYDLHVEGLHNFAAGISQSSGLFAVVHNSDETVAQDDRGRSLHIYSNNPKIRELLGELFYETLNVEFNLRPWVRSMCQYGDFFAFLDVSPQHGVINVFPIPVNEIEREEGYDPEDPLAVRFRWVTQGNTVLEAWQVAHFRLLGNDAFLPYGSSVLESARRIWRQLILIEDAMLVYRIVRSPERRIFYIDVGNIPPDDVPAYIEKAKSTLRSNQIVDKTTGRVDLRYNPLCNSLSSLVKLMDGRVLTLGSLIDEWDAGKRDQWVYSVDVEGKRLVPGKVEWAGITKRDAELVRVHIDSGTWFDCTPDHRFMLRDGSYKKAEDLQPDEALMPLYVGYTKKDGTREHNIEGYEKVYDPFTQSYVLTHRNNVIALRGFDAVKGKVIHHVDFEKLNNDPSNLEPMVWKEHMKLHGEAAAERNRTPGARELSRKTMLSTWEQGKIVPATFVRLWQDPAVRKSRVDRLTLRVDSMFIGHCHRILDEKGRGLSTKETEFRRWLNEDEQVIAYLRELNPTFKNGSVDKLCRSRLQSILKRLGLDNAFTQLKREWLVSRTNIDAIVTFCESMGRAVGRKEVMAHFSLSRADLQEIVRLAGHDYAEFSARYMQKTLRYRKDAAGYKNHRVTRVERLTHREDTGCITVGQWHNFAAGPSIESLSQETQALIAAGKPMRLPDDLANSLVSLHNSVDEDYFIPIRGGETGTRIDTLPGGTHVSAIDDVNYIQSKLFAALKVPKAYLGYDDALASKATLAQEDIRFSRTINTIQRVIISELNKIAAIHLYAHGFDGEDLLDFALQLSNPSTVAQQQKLELYRAKLEIAATAPEGLVDRYFLRSRVLGLTDDEIRKLEAGLERDRKIDAYFEALGGEEGGAGAGGFDVGGGGGAEELGGVGEEPGTAGGAGDLFASQERSGGRQLLTADDETPVKAPTKAGASSGSTDRPDDGPKPRGLKGFGPDGSPIKARSDTQLGRQMFNKRRQSTHGASKTHMPDFVGMTDMMGPQDVDVFDSRTLGIGTDPLSVGFDESLSRAELERQERRFDDAVTEMTRIDASTRSALRSFTRRFTDDSYSGDRPKSVIIEGTDEPHDGQEEWEIDITEYEGVDEE